jgi:hypothetical protein
MYGVSRIKVVPISSGFVRAMYTCVSIITGSEGAGERARLAKIKRTWVA